MGPSYHRTLKAPKDPMHHRSRPLSLTLLFLLVAPASAEAGPAELTRAVIDTFKAGGPKMAGRLDALFDFEAFTAACVEGVKERLTAEQIKSVSADIVGIVRARAYPRGGEIFRDGKITEGEAGKRGESETFDISIYFPKQDLAMDVLFAFNSKGRIVDVSFDDDSLTKDFRVQIARFLSKKSPAELVAKLTEKRKEAEKANK